MITFSRCFSSWFVYLPTTSINTKNVKLWKKSLIINYKNKQLQEAYIMTGMIHETDVNTDNFRGRAAGYE